MVSAMEKNKTGWKMRKVGVRVVLSIRLFMEKLTGRFKLLIYINCADSNSNFFPPELKWLYDGYLGGLIS